MLRTAFYRVMCVAVLSFCATGCIRSVNHRHNYVLAEAQDDYYANHFAEAFRKSYYIAKTGDPRAEYALGVMYFYGEGTIKDQDLARYWIRRAAYKHFPPAEHALYLLERSNVPQIKPGENFDPGYPAGKYIPRKSYCCTVIHKPVPGRLGETCPVGVCSPKEPGHGLVAYRTLPRPKFAANVKQSKKTLQETVRIASKSNSKPKHRKGVAHKTIKQLTRPHIVSAKAPDPFYAWATKQDDKRFTVQLTVTDKQKHIKHLADHHFDGKRVIPYSFHVGKEQRYSAVCGSFASQKDAQEFKKHLPKNLAQDAVVYRWGTLHKYMHPYS